jgi:nucleoside-diphosphate-sugar epimerase
MDAASVARAAEGVRLIVHAVNPPGYRNWGGLVLPMLDNTIAAARASGARVLLPGTIYNYGPNAFPMLREDSPQHPETRKGAIRVEMESRLRAASQDGENPDPARRRLFRPEAR